jgi:hypothetical protein
VTSVELCRVPDNRSASQLQAEGERLLPGKGIHFNDARYYFSSSAFSLLPDGDKMKSVRPSACIPRYKRHASVNSRPNKI